MEKHTLVEFDDGADFFTCYVYEDGAVDWEVTLDALGNTGIYFHTKAENMEKLFGAIMEYVVAGMNEEDRSLLQSTLQRLESQK